MLAEFLRIDDSLIEAAAEASPPMSAEGDSAEAMRTWIAALPVQEKDALLFRLTQEPPAIVHREILRRFRQINWPRRDDTSSVRRTVGQLLAVAEQRTQAKQRRAAEKKAREEARRAQEAARARQKYLDALAKRQPQTWQKVDALTATRQPKKYDEAVQLLCDLRDLSEREGKAEQTASRLSALRAAHSSKPSLIRRLDNAQL